MNTGSTSRTLTCVFYLLISLIVVFTSGKSLDNTDGQDLSQLLQRLDNVLTVIERKMADKPEAEVVDETLQLEERAHRRPRPEVNLELQQRSSIPEKNDALTRLITILERQHLEEEQDDGIVSPITDAPKEDPLTGEELKRLLSILQKRDWDAPFPITGSQMNSQSH